MTLIVPPMRTRAKFLVVLVLLGIFGCRSNAQTCASNGTCSVNAGSAGVPMAGVAGDATKPTGGGGVGNSWSAKGGSAGEGELESDGGRRSDSLIEVTAGLAGTVVNFAVAGATAMAGSHSSTGSGGQQSNEQALVVSIPDMKVRIVPGQTATVTLSLKRIGAVSGAIRVVFQGLPPGVGATDFDIPEGMESAQFPIKVVTNLQVGGPFSFNITAKSIDIPSVQTTVAANLFLVPTPGTLDTTFGSRGLTKLQIIPPSSATTMYGEDPRDIVVDDQSRVSICGRTYRNDVGHNGWIVRLAPSGILDDQFGQKGKLDFGGPETYVASLANGGRGLYLRAGFASSDSTPNETRYLRRLDQSGVADTTFNDGQDFILSSTDDENSVDDLQAFKNGILFVSAGIPKALTADGTADGSFVAPAGLAITRTAVDHFGRPLYAGFGDRGFVFGRLLNSGAIDSTFGTNGISTVPFRLNDDYAKIATLLPLPNGSLAAVVTSAYTRDVANAEASIQVFSESGTPLESYGQSGKVVVRSPGWAVGAVAQPDGRVTVVYVVFANRLDGLAVVSSVGLKRYLADGTLDTAFGQNGEALVTQIQPQSGIDSVAFDATAERIVIGGSLPNDSTHFGVLRFWL